MSKQYNNENKIVSLNIEIKKKEEEEINNKIKKLVENCNEKIIFDLIKSLKKLCEKKDREMYGLNKMLDSLIYGEINKLKKIIETQNNEINYLQNLLLEEEIDFDLSDI